MQASVKINNPPSTTCAFECGGKLTGEGRFSWEGVNSDGHHRIKQALIAGASQEDLLDLIRAQREATRYKAVLLGAREGKIPPSCFSNLQPELLKAQIRSQLAAHPDMLQAVMASFHKRTYALQDRAGKPRWDVTTIAGHLRHTISLDFQASLLTQS